MAPGSDYDVETIHGGGEKVFPHKQSLKDNIYMTDISVSSPPRSLREDGSGENDLQAVVVLISTNFTTKSQSKYLI